MKILFFLVVIANVALLMWELKTGAFVQAAKTSEQNADLDQEQILLVSELKNLPQIILPEPVSDQSTAENALTGEAGKPVLVPGSLTTLSEHIDQPALITESSPSISKNIDKSALIPEPLSSISKNIDKSVRVHDSLPAKSESFDKPALEKTIASDSNMSNADKSEVHCYEAGPFANKKAYQTWVSRLKDIESEIKQITRDGQVASEYMVYYPAAETELESGNNIKMLKNHGIKDLWLLKGEDKGKISLGLFNREDSALTMKNELLAKGINAEVKAKYKTKSQKYALIKGDGKLVNRLDNIKTTYPELPVKQIMDDTQNCR